MHLLLQPSLRRAAAALSAALALSACAASGAGTLPPAALHAVPPAAAAAAKTQTLLVLRIPQLAASRRGHYISPFTHSGALAVSADQGCAACTKAYSAAFNLVAGAPGCRMVASQLQCTLAIPLAPGSYTGALSLYRGPVRAGKASGAVLSANQSFPITVVSGTTNHVTMQLDGIAASIAVTAAASVAVTGTQKTGFAIVGSMPHAFLLVPKDAAGNIIAGPAAPTATIVAAPLDTTLSTPAPGAANTWSLTSTYVSTNPQTAASATIEVRATPLPGSGGTTVTAQIPLKLYQPWIYVANGKGQPITAYDEAGNVKTYTGTFPGISSPHSGVFSPSNGLLYVAQYTYAASQILAFDVMGNAVPTAGAFPTLDDPGQIALDTNTNTIYAPNYLAGYTNYVTAYDLQGNLQPPPAQTFSAMTNGAQAMVYDAKMKLLYGANFYTANVTGFDVTGAAKVTGFSGLYEPMSMALDTANGLLYVANQRNSATVISAFDEQGVAQALSGTFAGVQFPHAIAYDPYDDTLYVANYPASTWTVEAFDGNGNAKPLPPGAFSNLHSPVGIFVVP